MTTAVSNVSASSAIYSAVRSESHSTVSADIPISPPCRMVRVGTGGVLVVEYPDGTQDTIPGLLDGDQLPIQISKIIDASTTCANITIFW